MIPSIPENLEEPVESSFERVNITLLIPCAGKSTSEFSDGNLHQGSLGFYHLSALGNALDSYIRYNEEFLTDQSALAIVYNYGNEASKYLTEINRPDLSVKVKVLHSICQAYLEK